MSRRQKTKAGTRVTGKGAGYPGPWQRGGVSGAPPEVPLALSTRLRSTTALYGALLASPAVLALLTLQAGPSWALPQTGTVVGGQAQIVIKSAQEVDIVQATPSVVINWQSFNIGTGETVSFLQGSTLSSALNRVTGGGGISQINGTLTAPGLIALSNPAGVRFGPNANIDVGSIIATTANVGNQDFLAGNYNFTIPGSATGSVVNQGTISVAEGGLAALVAPGVANAGVINAHVAKVALSAATGFTPTSTATG